MKIETEIKAYPDNLPNHNQYVVAYRQVTPTELVKAIGYNYSYLEPHLCYYNANMMRFLTDNGYEIDNVRYWMLIPHLIDDDTLRPILPKPNPIINMGTKPCKEE